MSTTEQKGAFTSVAFKENRPIKDPSFNTFNLRPKSGGVTVTHKEKPEEADEVIIRVREGAFLVTTELVEAPIGMILIKDYVKNTSGKELYPDPKKKFLLRLTDNEKDGTTPEAWGRVPASAKGEPKAQSNVAEKTIAKAKKVEVPKKAVQKTGTASTTAKSPKGTDRGSAILILDASGSMWGQIKGKTKIEIAREVIGDLLQSWDTSMPLGLSAYGHRRKGDCNDIETLIPVGQADPKSIIKAIHAINPKGKTPLSEAVRRTAKKLRYSEERATVVLISDGVETCNMYPCAVGEELAMSGVDFTAHVIGFDVKDIDQAGLRCLAEKTDGLFLAAADAEGLREALSKTVEKAKETPAPLVEEPGEATVSCPPGVPAGSAFKVDWGGPNSRNDYISIATPNAPEGSHLNYTYTSKGNPATIYAPEKTGEYDIRYIMGQSRTVLARTSVTLTPVSANVTAPSSVATGTKFNVTWEGPNYRGDYISIAQAESKDSDHKGYNYTSRGNPAELKAPAQPGGYEVRYILNQSRTALARTPITVK